MHRTKKQVTSSLASFARCGNHHHSNKKPLQVHGKRRSPAQGSIGQLPNEILMKIFEHLDMGSLMRCSCVCHGWSMLCADNSLWWPFYNDYLSCHLNNVSQKRFEAGRRSRDFQLKQELLRKCREIRNKK